MEFPLDVIGAVTEGASKPAIDRQTAALTLADVSSLQARLEEALGGALPRALERIANSLPSGPDLERGLATFEDVAEGNFDIQRGALDQPLRDLVTFLPTPTLASDLVLDPAAFAQQLPSLGDTSLGGRQALLCSPDSALSIVRNPVFADRSEELCSILANVPQFDEVAEAIPLTADEVIDAVSELLEPVFDKTGTGETANQARQRFCRSVVGQRRAFDRLCER